MRGGIGAGLELLRAVAVGVEGVDEMALAGGDAGQAAGEVVAALLDDAVREGRRLLQRVGVVGIRRRAIRDRLALIVPMPLHACAFRALDADSGCAPQPWQ